MTYDKTSDNAYSGSYANDFSRGRHDRPDYFGWARVPGFNPMKLLTVVAGFAIFPPLGIAALIYFLWVGRRHGYGHGRDRYAFAASGERGCGHRHRRHSGNSAFDAHRDEVLDKLRAEREAFNEYRSEQRRKRDQESFDAFRNSRGGEGPATAQ